MFSLAPFFGDIPHIVDEAEPVFCSFPYRYFHAKNIVRQAIIAMPTNTIWSLRRVSGLQPSKNHSVLLNCQWHAHFQRSSNPASQRASSAAANSSPYFGWACAHSKKDSALLFIASYISVIVILMIKRIPNTKIMFSAHLIITLCRKTMCRMSFVCRKNSIFAKTKSRDGFQTEI